MATNCWLCKFLFEWKYANSNKIEETQEYKNELPKIYAKAKYQGSFLKMVGIALGFIYFLIRDHNENIFWLSCIVSIALVVLLVIETGRIFFLPRCIENEMNSLCQKEKEV
jgi:hypothetical protein